jgi:methylated-DNA-[protein]-cysteine S-methyltransferase
MAGPLVFAIERLATPIGVLLVVSDGEDRLRAVDWSDESPRLHRLLDRHYGSTGWRSTEASGVGAAAVALGAYFAGECLAVDSLAVATGGTQFQQMVWQALRAIPCGETVSYRRVAAGLANAANPIVIVVPCHRVIGSDGSLTGYAGGMERKRWLIDHEARAMAGPARASIQTKATAEAWKIDAPTMS